MSRENHKKRKHRKGSAKENENNDERSKHRLFTEADAKSVEITGYTLGRGAPQNDQLMQERTIPTGVVGVDRSLKLPSPPLQNHDSKAYTNRRPSEDHYKENVHLPPINHHPYYSYHDQPYGYYQTPPDYPYFGYLSPSYPVHHEYQSPHRHHHRHRHHKHHKEIETYDPRWWYMPINSVHAPKPWQPPDYHYVAPKWYESSSKQNKIPMYSPESVLSPRKYVDCRCELCRPSKKTPRVTRWIANE